jgi:hypothetical protein
MMSERTTVFVSYSHKNKRWLQRLRVHLTPFDRRGILTLWDDSSIDAGDKWRTEISDAIGRAAASIVLISADFLASDFVASDELPRLLRKAESDGSRILPIIVEPCDLGSHPELAAFQALNPPSKPLAEMSRVEAERVLVRAVAAIGKLLAAPGEAAGRPMVRRTGPAVPSESQHLFEQLQSASIALAVMCALADDASAYTLSDLEERLDIRSRKRAYEAVNQLTGQGWIERVRSAGFTKYHLTTEGVRQLQRLAAASDGPVRRYVSLNRSTPRP